MLKTTISALTAIVISMSSLNADHSTKKDMRVVGKVNDISGLNYVDNTYQNQSNQEAIIYTEPNPIEYTPAPYTSNQVVQPSPSYKDTIIYAKPAKRLFKVREPIRVRLKLKHRSSLYIWTVGRDGRGYMILPNRFNGYNRFKRNYAYVFPEPSLNYEFQSDRAGTEHIYILATNKPISNARMRAIFNRRVGHYLTATAKATKEFTTRDIHVIAKNEHLKYDIAHVAIQITDGRRRYHKPSRGRKRESDIIINITNH